MSDIYYSPEMVSKLRLDYLKLQQENAQLKAEIKALNERLKAEEDKNLLCNRLPISRFGK